MSHVTQTEYKSLIKNCIQYIKRTQDMCILNKIWKISAERIFRKPENKHLLYSSVEKGSSRSTSHRLVMAHLPK